MQINSSWVSSLGLSTDMLLSDPCYNVMTGARILRLCIDEHGYTWKAVGCYNAVSRQKRIGYSWKVYNELKAEGRAKSKEQGAKSVENSEHRTPNSSLFFSVRDDAAVE